MESFEDFKRLWDSNLIGMLTPVVIGMLMAAMMISLMI